MDTSFSIVQIKTNEKTKSNLDFLSKEIAKKAYAFHKSFPIYEETPLVEMKNLAKVLGVNNIYIKDESYRFGLNAFKVLGGSFAIGNFLAQKLGMDINELPYPKMVSKEIKERLGEITFVTATDGNHGRGIAWTANQLNQKSVVYMPKGSSPERLEKIQAEGAEASITDFNYDDAVRIANKDALEKGYIMVQDTAWKGYEEMPTWIMQGYTTMAYEAFLQLKENPTHIFLQAGVGAMSGGITGIIANLYKENKPIITIVEPNKAACLYKTAKANDGDLHFVTGEMDTIMVGLACGEPCTIGWNVLKDYAENFISCPDYVAAKGMRILGNPPQGDDRVISGESGAATLGCVAQILTDPKLVHLKDALKLDENSKILFFSTEGDTDRENYLATVWDGKDNSYNK